MASFETIERRQTRRYYVLQTNNGVNFRQTHQKITPQVKILGCITVIVHGTFSKSEENLATQAACQATLSESKIFTNRG